MVYSIIRVQAEGRKVIYDFGTNDRGEHITVELSREIPQNPLRKLRIWDAPAHSCIEQPNRLSVSVYAEDAGGIIVSRYNPTHGAKMRHDMAWMMEDTPENRQKMLAEIYRRAFEEVRA
jgi:hypothetical protein